MKLLLEINIAERLSTADVKAIEELATQNHRTVDEVAAELLRAGLAVIKNYSFASTPKG
jgi:hypothetical protein